VRPRFGLDFACAQRGQARHLVASTADAYRNQIASDDAKYRKLIPALGIATQ